MLGQLILSSYTFADGMNVINQAFSASTDFAILSATTYFSGSTPLETVVSNIANSVIVGGETFIQPGLNTYTAGTSFHPTINISAATLSYLSAVTISATTF